MNYPSIALTDTVGKIVCSIVNERMKAVVERSALMGVGEKQNGCRRDRRWEDNLHVIIEMIERLKKYNNKGYFASLDIEKAYDRIDRKVLCAVLRHTVR